MGLKAVFEKQGGMGLVKQYIRGGAFFTAGCEFLLLGKEKKALEILRLSAQYKIKKRLEKRYRRQIEELNAAFDDTVPHQKSNKVWVCWFQGMESAPQLVQKCYQSLKKNLTDREIILITSENMDEYVQFPEYIMEKWRAGLITHTHMTDLLRLELLIRYGGMWIDSTVLCTSKRQDIPDYFFDSDLFLYQALKPGRDGQSQLISSWLISAKTNNRILTLTRDLCYEYWRTNDKMVDYFLVHDFMSIALEQNPDEWNRIVPRDNATPHNLLLRMFDQYDPRMWQAMIAQTPFHKLSYKFSEEDAALEGTYFRYIIQ